MGKKLGILLIFLFSCQLLAGCAAGSDINAEGLQTVTLKLKWKHQFQFAGYYIAKEKGYYEQAGLSVIIEEASEGQEAIDDVLNSKADFGIGSSDLAISYIEGKPIVVVAALFQHSPLVLIANRSHGIENIHNLTGKRVMIEPHAEELIAYMRNEGVSIEDLILYPHSFDIQPLIDNEIDAMSAYITDEVYLIEEQEIDSIVFYPQMGGIDFYADTLFTSQKIAREDPEMVQAFLLATQQGWDYAFNHVEETIGLILTKYSDRHTQEQLAYEASVMTEYVLPDIVEIGYMNEGRWEHIAGTYATLGMVPEDYSLEGFIFTPPDEVSSNPYQVILIGFLVTVSVLLLILFSHGFINLFFLARDRFPRFFSNLNTDYE